MKTVSIVIALLMMGCCSLDENRASKEAFLAFSYAVQVEHDYLVKHGVLDAKIAEANAAGDRRACLEHAEMKHLVTVGFPAMVRAIEAWARGEEVVVPSLPDPDLSSVCPQ